MINILGMKYKLIEAPIEDQGLCLCENLEIVIRSSLPKAVKRRVILHEWLEAINYENRVKLTHDQIDQLTSILGASPHVCFKWGPVDELKESAEGYPRSESEADEDAKVEAPSPAKMASVVPKSSRKNPKRDVN